MADVETEGDEVTAENVEATPMPESSELDVDNVDLSRVAGAGLKIDHDGEPVPVGNEAQRKYAEKVAATFKRPAEAQKTPVKPTAKPVPKPAPEEKK
jgi:hypothetical protein